VRLIVISVMPEPHLIRFIGNSIPIEALNVLILFLRRIWGKPGWTRRSRSWCTRFTIPEETLAGNLLCDFQGIGDRLLTQAQSLTKLQACIRRARPLLQHPLRLPQFLQVQVFVRNFGGEKLPLATGFLYVRPCSSPVRSSYFDALPHAFAGVPSWLSIAIDTNFSFGKGSRVPWLREIR